MSIYNHSEFRDHENVFFCYDQEADLRAIVAIHSTSLGPAAGGCRMLPYGSEAEALEDALRLSFAMSYKNAVAGLPLGGGKTVVIADPADSRKPDRLRALGRHIQRLHGTYWAAIDVGISPQDVDIISEECEFTFARSDQYDEGSGCGEFTANGGLAATRAAVKCKLGRDSLEGVRVAIQGLGQVGAALGRRLHAAGAQLIVTDINPATVDVMVQECNATAVEPDAIYDQEVDVFAPCALGATLNDETIPRLRAKIVCGMANNQLAQPHHDEMMMQHGIAWAPDFVVNAGGMLGASGPVYGEHDRDRLNARVLGIGDTVEAILIRAEREHRPPGAIADDMARERIAAGRAAS